MRQGLIQLLVGAATLLAATSARADSIALLLPVERATEEQVVVLSLRESRVDVLIDPAAEPVLRIDDLLRGDESSGFVLLEPDDKTLRVGQPHGQEDVAPRLVVQLVLRPDQRFELQGTDVDVTIRSAVVEAASEVAEEASPNHISAGTPRQSIRPGRGNHLIDLQMDGGTVELDGVSRAQVTATGTQVNGSQTRGPIDLAVRSGEIDVSDHRGPLLLTAERTSVELRNLQGAMSAHVTGASVAVYGGEGKLVGDGEDGEFLVQSWSGPIDFRGELHRIDVLGSGTASKTLTVSGADLDVSVSDFAGAVTADLSGGSLDVRNLGGRAKIKARLGTRVRLENIQDTIDFRAESSTDCIVQKIGRSFQARIEDSRLDARDLRQVRISALRSFVYLEDVQGTADITLTDAEGELDLSGSRAASKISLQGASEASVVLPEPCAVRGQVESDDTLQRQTIVDGCQLITAESQYRSAFGDRRKGSTPAVLTATIAEDSTLEVRGRP